MVLDFGGFWDGLGLASDPSPGNPVSTCQYEILSACEKWWPCLYTVLVVWSLVHISSVILDYSSFILPVRSFIFRVIVLVILKGFFVSIVVLVVHFKFSTWKF